MSRIVLEISDREMVTAEDFGDAWRIEAWEYVWADWQSVHGFSVDKQWVKELFEAQT